MSSTVVLLTRDLRVHDHPALAAAAADGTVLPLFVFDDRLTRRSANRTAFLLGALKELRSSLAARGAPLVIRRGDPRGRGDRPRPPGRRQRDPPERGRRPLRPAAGTTAPARGGGRGNRCPLVPRRHRRAAGGAGAGRRRPLPGLHALLAALVAGAPEADRRDTAAPAGAGGDRPGADAGTAGADRRGAVTGAAAGRRTGGAGTVGRLQGRRARRLPPAPRRARRGGHLAPQPLPALRLHIAAVAAG